ncbi:interleukin-8 [Amia ocellicauda]|uniref:interleukin-8 n=1 Tax=Amia ocellicauda TaxID=2972642 RepID=UPI0034639B98
MNCKITVTVLILCLAFATLSEGMSGKSLGTELRCQCIKTESRFIPPKMIGNVELFPSGPHCKDVEVIATLKTGQKICLNPTSPWVKIMIDAIMQNKKP